MTLVIIELIAMALRELSMTIALIEIQELPGGKTILFLRILRILLYRKRPLKKYISVILPYGCLQIRFYNPFVVQRCHNKISLAIFSYDNVLVLHCEASQLRTHCLFFTSHTMFHKVLKHVVLLAHFIVQNETTLACTS